ncbi:BspA family leucine-rich repeat surface protein, partial [Cyclobacteriaceae bacterium]|nr:BspA family leucine-rich repeat surface protein [Cyclobacteriaceae bacterium]
SVTNMDNLFNQAFDFNQDISSWDVSNVTSMSDMFSYTDFNQDISSWDVRNVTNMSAMFANTDFNQDISFWDVSKVTDMNSVFAKATSFNQDIGRNRLDRTQT